MSELAENLETEDNSSESVTTESQETNQATEANENSAAKNDNKPAGYYPVDPKTATPEEMGDRINYIYGQLKHGTRKHEKELSEWRKVAEQQSKTISELQNATGAVVNHLQQKTFNETEANLKAQLKTAYETGDTTLMADVNDRLAEVKARKLYAEQNKQKQPVQQESRTAPQYEYDESAQFDGKEIVEAWQAETDENGNALRPWSKAGHSENGEALAITYSVMNNPKYENYTMEQKLAVVDSRMGINKPQGGKQNVMGGRLTSKSKVSKLTLSPDAEKLAIRTRFGSKNGAKTDADYIEAYRKQMESVNKKGAK